MSPRTELVTFIVLAMLGMCVWLTDAPRILLTVIFAVAILVLIAGFSSYHEN